MRRLFQAAVLEGVPAAIREEAAEVPTSAGVAPEAAASAAFNAAIDAMSDLTCPEGNAFSISGCNTLCLVCELLVEDPCPPCSIGADKAGALPCMAGCSAEVALFSDELGCALFSDELGGWGTKVGDVPEVLFSDELGCALFSDELGGWGTKVGDVPEVLFSDELGCALFSDELGCALFSEVGALFQIAVVFR